jgi:hypothetical protein
VNTAKKFGNTKEGEFLKKKKTGYLSAGKYYVPGN